MDLKSIFHRDKSVSSAPLPQPPSVREMLEDIENSSKNDPVYLFANHLQRKGSKKASIGSLDSNLSDSINTTPVGRLSKGRSVSESDSNSQPSTPVRVISSPFVDVSDASADVSGDPTESIYYKLRKFISLNEQTQEMSIDVEAKLKEFESENKEFIKVLLEAKKDSGSSTSRKSSLT